MPKVISDPFYPWNEIECGGHYARAMSSWSLLLALSGYEYDGPNQTLRFTPRHTPENCRCFFCGPEGWGTFNQKFTEGAQRTAVQVQWGQQRVKSLDLALAGNLKPTKVTVTIANGAVPSSFVVNNGRVEIKLETAASVKEGQTIEVAMA